MGEFGKKWYESKTLWFALLTILIGVAGAFGFVDFAPDAEQQALIGAIITVVIGVVNVVLRAVTSAPLKFRS